VVAALRNTEFPGWGFLLSRAFWVSWLGRLPGMAGHHSSRFPLPAGVLGDPDRHFGGRSPALFPYEWWRAALSVLAGLVSIVFGILIAAQPSSGLLAVVWLIGVYAIVFGVMYIAVYFESRSWLRAWPEQHPLSNFPARESHRMRSDRERGIPVLHEKKRWNEEKPEARARMKEKNALRSFPTKDGFELAQHPGTFVSGYANYCISGVQGKGIDGMSQNTTDTTGRKASTDAIPSGRAGLKRLITALTVLAFLAIGSVALYAISLILTAILLLLFPHCSLTSSIRLCNFYNAASHGLWQSP